MSKVEPTQRALDQAAHDEEIKRLRDERDHYRENVIPDLQAQLDQERQRRKQDEQGVPRLLSRDEALLVLYDAIDHPFGKTTDDKVILERLRSRGYCIAAAPQPEHGESDE